MNVLEVIWLAFFFIIGAMMGSFACCQAWRLRLKEEKKKNPGKWSVCLHCKKKLGWYENIPLVSWLIQRGKCRKCHKKIGIAEFAAELGSAISFMLIAWFFWHKHFNACAFLGNLSLPASEDSIANCFMTSPTLINLLPLASLLMLILAAIGFIILTVYDAKWGLLPVSILTYTIICAIIYSITLHLGNYLKESQLAPNLALNIISSIAILAGVYYLLYKLSNEKLVGGGDWLLCLAIAIILGNWWLAFFELFLSNLICSVIMLAAKNKQAPFGPFLVAAFVIVFVFQDFFMNLFVM